MSEQRKPKELDIVAGKYMRTRRNQANVTQMMVADAVGVTFQQVQKVEKGVNRMSLSAFFKYCEAVKVTPQKAVKDILELMEG